MKVLVGFVFVISTVSALGSGPYLPSGWRPSGPAFLLPSELRTGLKSDEGPSEPKSVDDLIASVSSSAQPDKPESVTSETGTSEETLVSSEQTTLKPEVTKSDSISSEPEQGSLSQENEASGSDFLREYGPPAVLDIHQSITVQGLPDIVTEHTFKVVDAKVTEDQVVIIKGNEESIKESVVASKTPEDVSALTNAVIETKSVQEDVPVQTLATVEPEICQDTTTETDFKEATSEAVPQKLEEGTTGTTQSQTSIEETTKIDDSLLVKSIDAVAKVTESASLEYLPPVSNEESVQNSKETGKEDTAVILEVPLTTSEKTEDNEAVGKNNNIEEGSGLGKIPDVLNEQERVGFREYGPPKSEEERIKNNETRKRRFSSRFASFKKH
ncbi:uncharacterized protein LOC114365905 [Ostrinia furnacalis]|uniref:uncharacterized protein LOC114365905 n=1 Tax=Ostrinia furnacalis TaxID=93504 RepID=UPI00103B8838|nr:uncharacterized protein LOC114365905 [Ostrinia furnacalis]